MTHFGRLASSLAKLEKRKMTEVDNLKLRIHMIKPLLVRGHLPIKELQAIQAILLTGSDELDQSTERNLLMGFFRLLNRLTLEQLQLIKIDSLLTENFLKIANQHFGNTTSHQSNKPAIKITQDKQTWDIPHLLASQVLNCDEAELLKATLTEKEFGETAALAATCEEADEILRNFSTQSEKIKSKVFKKLVKLIAENEDIKKYSELEELYINYEPLIFYLIKQGESKLLLKVVASAFNKIDRNILRLKSFLILAKRLQYLYGCFLDTIMGIEKESNVYSLLLLEETKIKDKRKRETNVEYRIYDNNREWVKKVLEVAYEIEKMLISSDSGLEGTEQLITLSLLKTHPNSKKLLSAFSEFKAHFDKINARNGKQYQVDWLKFEVQRLDSILMLVDVMGPDAFSFFKSFIAQTCLPLERMLASIDVLPEALIEKVCQIFEKENKWKNEQMQTFIHFITCLSCVLYMLRGQYLNEGEKVISESIAIINKHQVNGFLAIYNALTSYLLQCVFQSDEEENTTIFADFETLSSRIPPHLFTRLMRSKKHMEGDKYEPIFTEMIKCDVLPKYGNVWQLCHDEEQDLTVLTDLAEHNSRIKQKLLAQGIDPEKALNYKKTFDFSISLGKDRKIDLSVALKTLMLYLDKVVKSLSSMEAKENDKQNGKKQAIFNNYKTLKGKLDKLEKGNKSIIKLLDEGSSILLNKIKNNLDNIVKTDYMLESSRELKEFIEHFNTQLKFVRNNLQQYEKNKQSQNNLYFRVQQWDKNDPKTFFLGDYVNCCLASNANQFSACVQRRMDDSMQFFVVTNVKTGEPVSLLWMYFAEDEKNNIYIVMNFPEVAPKYGVQPEIRKALLTALLQFTEQYMQDNPNIKKFLMEDLTYGWNIKDLDQFPKVAMPEGFDKLAGPFIPGYSPDEDDTSQDGKRIARNFTMEHYYLKSLDSSELHEYSSKYLDQEALACIQRIDLITSQYLSDITTKTIEQLVQSGEYTKEQLMQKIDQFVLIDEIWYHVEVEAKSYLTALLEPFYSNEESLGVAIDIATTEFRQNYRIQYSQKQIPAQPHCSFFTALQENDLNENEHESLKKLNGIRFSFNQAIAYC